MSKPRKSERLEPERRDDEVALARGDLFACARPGGVRLVVVDGVDWSQGTPRAHARELAVPCGHGLGDGCPLCPPAPDGRAFEVALTYRAMRHPPEVSCWVLPSWYAPVARST